jgi:2,5-diketo-D-gluconate reductase A
LDAIRQAGAAHGKTPAQVILRWHIQQGIVAIPKASSRPHMDENADIFDFELSEEEMAAIDALDTNERLAANPDNVN